MKKTFAKIRLSTLLCYLLAAVLLFGSLPVTAFGITTSELSETGSEDPAVDEQDTESTAQPELFRLGAGEKSLAELQTMQVNAADIPEMIPLSKAEEKGHVNRLRAQETNLSTVIFQNRDGNKTTYIYSQPVKYVDANGNVCDKSTAITALTDTAYAYAMRENSVRVFFPGSMATGVRLDYAGYQIQMIPQTTAAASPLYDAENNTVTYANVFGKGTLLHYQTLLAGVKEDIILVKNIGESSFVFTLQATGLTPQKTADGIWQMVDAEGEIIAEFAPIVARDSGNKTVVGSMEITPSTARGEYTVTVSVPESFLNATDTVYPVYIDPTTYIWETNSYPAVDEFGDHYSQSYRSIVDISYYNTTDSYDEAEINHDGYHLLGNNIAGGGSGFIVYYFTDFYRENSDLTNLMPGQIASARLYLSALSGTQINIKASPLNYNNGAVYDHYNGLDVDFTEEVRDSINTSVYSTATMGAAAMEDFQIDISEIVKGWVRYNAGYTSQSYNPVNGLALYCDNSVSAYRRIKMADSMGYIYCVLDTTNLAGDIYFSNKGTQKFLSTNGLSNVNMSVYEEYDTIHWNLSYVGTDLYSIYSANSGMAFGVSGDSFEFSEYPSSESYEWSITWSDQFGYRIRNSSTGKYLYCDTSGNLQMGSASVIAAQTNVKNTLWTPMACSEFVPLQNFSITGNDWFAMNSSTTVGVSISPTNASFGSRAGFTWELSNPSAFSISSAGRVTCSATVCSASVLTVTHKATGIQQKIEILCGVPFENGIYMLKNAVTGSYMQTGSKNENGNNYAELWDFSIDNGERWYLTRVSTTSDEYTIQSLDTNKYLGTQSHAASENTLIYMYDTPTGASCRWRIIPTANGTYKIVSTQNLELVIGYQYEDTTNSLIVKTCIYDNDSVKEDEWNLYQEKYTATINNYYDKGYYVRYGETEAEGKEKIYQHTTLVAQAYMEMYGLKLSFSEASYFESPLDICKGTVTNSNIDSLCTCGQNHSSRDQLMESFNSSHPGNATTINIFWTGHKITSTAPDGDLDENRSCTSITHHTVFILDIVGVHPNNRVRLIYPLMHELNHQFGAKDHYHELDTNSDCVNQETCSECQDTNIFNNCIMGDLLPNSLYRICSYCKSEIQAHLHNHH